MIKKKEHFCEKRNPAREKAFLLVFALIQLNKSGKKWRPMGSKEANEKKRACWKAVAPTDQKSDRGDA